MSCQNKRPVCSSMMEILMDWQKACTLLFASCMVLCASVAVGQGVADPSLVFQLEGNLRTDTDICFQLSASGALTVPSNLGSCPAGFTDVVFAARTEDWDKIASGTSSASAKSYISPSTTPAEAINSSGDDIFTAGGSKDTLGISTGPWKWKNGKPQAKDDIEGAFAAAYTLPGVVNGSLQACGGANQPNCDTAVYFGMTRYGRVLFYDYDEVEYLTDCAFRAIPQAPNPEAELSEDVWYAVGPRDVFPEEFGPFLLGEPQVRIEHRARGCRAGPPAGRRERRATPSARCRQPTECKPGPRRLAEGLFLGIRPPTAPQGQFRREPGQSCRATPARCASARSGRLRRC